MSTPVHGWTAHPLLRSWAFRWPAIALLGGLLMLGAGAGADAVAPEATAGELNPTSPLQTLFLLFVGVGLVTMLVGLAGMGIRVVWISVASIRS